jgi:hypothetical protein
MPPERKDDKDLSRGGKFYRNYVDNLLPSEADDFREYEKLRKREYRKKLNNPELQTEEKKEIKEKKVKSTSDRNYSTLNQLSRLLQNEEFDGANFSFITDDYEDTVKFIQKTWTKDNTQKSKINAMLFFIREAELNKEDGDMGSDAHAYLNSKLKEIQARLTENIKKNTMSERDEKAWQDWGNIEKIRPRLKEQQEKVVFDLYTKIPPQHLEYRSLKIKKQRGKDKEGYPEGNTLLVDRRDIPQEIILRDFKGDGKKEDITIIIPSGIRRYITTYMKKRKVSEGDYLFPEEIRTPDGFSRYVSNMFKKYTGIPTTVNTLRKIYNTHHSKSDKTYQDAEDRAKAMNTSVYQAATAYTKKEQEGVEETKS